MNKIIPLMAIIFLITGLLASCAHSDLTTPCPDFGKWCTKTPINSWNYNS